MKLFQQNALYAVLFLLISNYSIAQNAKIVKLLVI